MFELAKVQFFLYCVTLKLSPVILEPGKTAYLKLSVTLTPYDGEVLIGFGSNIGLQ